MFYAMGAELWRSSERHPAFRTHAFLTNFYCCHLFWMFPVRVRFMFISLIYRLSKVLPCPSLRNISSILLSRIYTSVFVKRKYSWQNYVKVTKPREKSTFYIKDRLTVIANRIRRRSKRWGLKGIIITFTLNIFIFFLSKIRLPKSIRSSRR